jgi:DNA polymerase III subunit beta
VLEKEFLAPIPVEKQLFRDTLTRVSVLANERFKGVTLDVGDNLLKITTHNPDHDEAEEEVPVEFEGEAFTIAFNATYLLDAIANLEGDKVSVIIDKDISTCFIQEPEQEIYKFVVMPMRL